jgi:AraC family transcriptional regulator
VSDVGVIQMIRGCDDIDARGQSGRDSASEHASLRVVSRLLDTALRTWNEDNVQAKSQVKVAAAMLHGYIDDSPGNGKHAATPSASPGLAPWQARKVRKFIDDSLDSTIRLRDCASKARLSAAHFSHVFKSTFGTTVHHYIRRRRIERAQQLMLISKQPLSQIALACGFATQAHFCTVFRKVVGLSPNAWRHRNMNLAPDE